MKKENVCEGHIPSFFIGDPKYNIVSEKECIWCNHNKSLSTSKKEGTELSDKVPSQSSDKSCLQCGTPLTKEGNHTDKYMDLKCDG